MNEEYKYVLERFAGIVAGTLVKMGRITMKNTIMKMSDGHGFSNHNATISITENEEGERFFHIYGPKSMIITMPWEDVLEAGMEFVRKVAEE